MKKNRSKNKIIKYIQRDPPKIEGKYYRGRIAKFNPVTGYGFVESQNGSHIFFYADQIRLEGRQNHKSSIQPGKIVGFDVGWTERGIRICKMKIFQEEKGLEKQS
jgi:cold shock CspA family protein